MINQSILSIKCCGWLIYQKPYLWPNMPLVAKIISPQILTTEKKKKTHDQYAIDMNIYWIPVGNWFKVNWWCHFQTEPLSDAASHIMPMCSRFNIVNNSWMDQFRGNANILLQEFVLGLQIKFFSLLVGALQPNSKILNY